jgi:hypothetical protein
MLLMATYYELISWLERHMLTCPSRRFLHIDCPGCGFQRSIMALLKGELGQSLHYYPATIPILFLLGYVMLHLKYNFLKGAAIIKYLQLSIAIVITVFYIYKIINPKIAA